MPVVPTEPVKISIVSSPSILPVIRPAVDKLCRLVGFDETCAGGIVLAVDEALANIIEHAYDGRQDQPIEVTLTPRMTAGVATGLEVGLRDFGRVVDPCVIRGRPLEDVRPGGLGVHIMRSCMDEVEYIHPQEGGTLLRMGKRLPASSSPGSAGSPKKAGEPQHG